MTLAALIAIVGLGLQTPTANRNLDAVRTLYAAAAYEDALARVSAMEASAVTADFERVRALCLVALGRRDDAVISIERLVWLAPGFVLGPEDGAPPVVELFRETRARVFKNVVADRYAQARTAFDAKDFARAARDLGGLLSLLDASPLGPSEHAELRQLAAGFLRLAELEIAAAARAAAAPPPVPVVTEPVVTPAAVYSSADADVRPPVELERPMPAWNPPPALASREFRGQVEVVVDETGRVEQARMIRPVVASYDPMLVDATKRWRYAPATRLGEAVKYRLTIEVVLSPRR